MEKTVEGIIHKHAVTAATELARQVEIELERHTIKCPECKKSGLQYDGFEDMYHCDPCHIFYYPEQVGAKTNKNAEIYKL